jgi:cytochrome P450
MTFHAHRRRLLGPCFAEASLNSLEPAVFERAKLAIDKIGHDLETTGKADILKWWTLFAMDVISELCFGESFRMLDQGKVRSEQRSLFTPISFTLGTGY